MNNSKQPLTRVELGDLDKELKAIYDELKEHEALYKREKLRIETQNQESFEYLWNMRQRLQMLENMHTDKLQELNALNL